MTTRKKTVRVNEKKMSVTAPAKPQLEYEKDFFKWTKHQASLLKKRDLEHLDIQNLIEEIKSLGRSDKRALRNHLIVLLLHLLKIEFQPDGKGNSKSWESSVWNASLDIKFLIEDSPSLKNELVKFFSEAYEISREKASIETQMNIQKFPIECPWSLEEVLPFMKKGKKKS